MRGVLAAGVTAVVAAFVVPPPALSAISPPALSAISSPAHSAPGEFVNGSGRASAQVISLGPSVASLPAAPTVARALADHTGTVGRGEAQAIDWSALELYLNPDVVAATPPLRVTSTDEGSELGRTASAAAAIVQQAWATDAPLGRSAATLGSLSVPGLVEIAGGRAEAWSGVVGGPVREAVGIAEIPALRLAGGLVELEGLRWEAVQRTGVDGAVEHARGTFTAGSLRVAGVAVLPGELTTTLLGTVLGVLDTALGPAGLSVRMPEEIVQGGAVRITPLTIHYEATEATKGLLGPVLDLLDPVRLPLTTTLNDLLGSLGDKDSLPVDPAIVGLTLDVLFGELSGSASFDLELGGAAAFTEGEVFDDFDLFGGGELGTLPAAPVSGAAATSAPGTPAGVATEVAGARVDAAPAPAPAEQAVGPLDLDRPWHRSWASAAWAAALLGLLACAALAAADRHRGPVLRVPPVARDQRPPPIT